MQAFEKWMPVPRAPALLHGAYVLQLGTNDLLVVCDGHFANGKCAILAFGAVEAIQSTQENLPHWEPELARTNPVGWPFLTVVNSEWAANLDVFDEGLVHYCIVSADFCVEVLSARPPEVRWATGAEIDALTDAAMLLGKPTVESR